MNKLSTWLPIGISLIVILINFGVTYGQTSTSIDSVKSDTERVEIELDKLKDKTEIKLDNIDKSLTDSRIKQAEMNAMMQQLIILVKEK